MIIVAFKEFVEFYLISSANSTIPATAKQFIRKSVQLYVKSYLLTLFIV